MVVTALSAKLNFDFPYWGLDEGKIQEQENYKVNL